MWKPKQIWTRIQNGKEEPNLDALSGFFGDDVVPVHVQYQKGIATARPVKWESTVSEYASWWHENHVNGQKHDTSLHYLLAWKFVAIHPEYNACQWPKYFQDNLLNGLMGHTCKFVYLWPAGTCTWLHTDVLCPFSWSTYVCGQKWWYLIPPHSTFLLYDWFAGSLASHLHANLNNGMDVFFPDLARAWWHAIEVIQELGETIFVSSNWCHTAKNMWLTLSINHNWLNGTNILWSWEKLQTEIKSLHNSKRESNNEGQSDKPTRESASGDMLLVGDDFLLLWHVLSRKAHSILSNDDPYNEMAIFNLKRILTILEGIQQVIHDGKDQWLMEWCEWVSAGIDPPAYMTVT